jgi:hypothetical protein
MADSPPTPAAPVSKADTSRLVSGKGRLACLTRVWVLRLVEPTAFWADAVRPAGRVADFLMLGGWRWGDACPLLVHRRKVSPVRHIIQLCPPQWAVCDDGVYCIDRPYQIAAPRFNENWLSHMSEKPWVDVPSLDEALTAGQAHYESGALAVKPDSPEDPPFQCRDW